jgi:hypothetical protein
MFAFEGVMVAGIAASSNAVQGFVTRHASEPVVVALYALLSGSTLAFIGFLSFGFRAVYPDVTPRVLDESEGSPFFFGSIASLPLPEFERRSRALDVESIELALIRQTHVNAAIAGRKFHWLKRAFPCLIVQASCLIVSSLLVAMTPAPPAGPVAASSTAASASPNPVSAIGTPTASILTSPIPQPIMEGFDVPATITP